MPGSSRILWYVAMVVLVIIGYILGCTMPPSGREEYRVVEFGVGENAAQAEAMLNQNAKEGWKFRGSIGSHGVLAR